MIYMTNQRMDSPTVWLLVRANRPLAAVPRTLNPSRTHEAGVLFITLYLILLRQGLFLNLEEANQRDPVLLTSWCPIQCWVTGVSSHTWLLCGCWGFEHVSLCPCSAPNLHA